MFLLLAVLNCILLANADEFKSGCFDGLCWADCFDKSKWCYTTPGDSMYKTCKTDDQCSSNWNCKGKCFGYESETKIDNKDKVKEVSSYKAGCYKGLCWADCFDTSKWCYTTSGDSMLKPCRNDDECSSLWQCQDDCIAYASELTNNVQPQAQHITM